MRREIKILMLTNMLCLMGYALMTPLYPLVAANYNISESVLGLIFSLYSQANVISIPTLPFIFSKINKSILLKLSISLDAACCLIFGLIGHIDNKDLFIIISASARFIQGITNAITSTITYSMAVYFSDKGSIKKNIGLMELSASTGLAIGPIIGSFLFHFFGFETPFIVLALLKIILVVIIVKKLIVVESQCKKSNFCRSIFNYKIFISFIAVVITLATVNFYYPVLGTYLNRKFDLSAELCGVFFVVQTFSYFLSINLIEKVHELFGTKMTMGLGQFFNFLFVLMLPPIRIFPSSVIMSVIGLTGLGMAEALSTIPSVEDFMNTLRDDLKIEETTANDLSSAIYNFGVNLGDSIGPVIGGYLTENNGFDRACFFISVINILWFFVFTLSSLKIIKKQISKKDEEEKNASKRRTRLNGFGVSTTKVELTGYQSDFEVGLKRQMIIGKEKKGKEIRGTYEMNGTNLYQRMMTTEY